MTKNKNKDIEFPAFKTIDDSDVVEDLLLKCLQKDSSRRITIDEVMKHKFLNQ
jgi:hypothetical protein